MVMQNASKRRSTKIRTERAPIAIDRVSHIYRSPRGRPLTVLIWRQEALEPTTV
jgi:hypothetical protein